MLERGTDRVDPLRCERLNSSSVCGDSFSGHLFCGDIDGVPLGQRGVLPGSTQINRLVQDAAHGAEPEPMLGASDARTPTTALYTPPFYHCACTCRSDVNVLTSDAPLALNQNSQDCTRLDMYSHDLNTAFEL
ncbi:unnamed protein product [Danaus chrysippus]|uniref:(African queen) hypothetical protein n=1 Tax=Danaus chrysippus TaxID=151541 RepID=A0A8J2VWA8_9NEOP|nr:unnamed protein product [Danaus chrysippus]